MNAFSIFLLWHMIISAEETSSTVIWKDFRFAPCRLSNSQHTSEESDYHQHHNQQGLESVNKRV